MSVGSPVGERDPCAKSRGREGPVHRDRRVLSLSRRRFQRVLTPETLGLVGRRATFRDSYDLNLLL